MGREYVVKKKRKGELHYVVETVSGMENPTTPKFSTVTELINYLTKNGELIPRGKPIPKEQVQAFVTVGFVPSGMVCNGKWAWLYECAPFLLKEKEDA